jgi:hypothetical protein
LPKVFGAALEHEGVKAGAIVSHVEVFRRWFNNNPAQDSLEKTVVYVPDLNGYDPARAILNTEVANVESAAVADPDQGHTNALPPNVPGKVQPAVLPCQVRLFP